MTDATKTSETRLTAERLAWIRGRMEAANARHWSEEREAARGYLADVACDDLIAHIAALDADLVRVREERDAAKAETQMAHDELASTRFILDPLGAAPHIRVYELADNLLKSADAAAHAAHHAAVGLMSELDRRTLKIREAERALAEAKGQQAALIGAFLAKWDDAEKSINGCIHISQIHGIPYTGPSLSAEIHALRLLTAPAPTDGGRTE